MKKLLLAAFLFISASTYSQIYRSLSGFEPTTNRPGYIYKDTVTVLPNVPLRYLTGYGTFGSLLDSIGGIGWGTSGTTAIGSNFLGTLNNQSLRFRTNNTQYAVLDSNGRFGIGIAQPLSILSVIANSIGVTQTTAKSALLQNQTAATVGNPQWSPSLIFSGQQWNSLTPASQDLSFKLEARPLSGANVQGTFNLSGSTNAGAYINLANWDLKTGLYTLNGQHLQLGSGGENGFASGFRLDGTTTNRYISFKGTSAVTIGQDNTTQNLTVRVATTSSGITQGTQAVDVDKTSGALLVGGTANDQSAILNISRTERGFLPPRLTTAQRDSINLTVSSVTIVNGGTGYTSNPALSFTNPTYPGVQAAAVVTTRVGNSITVVTVGASGSYTSTPTITVTGGGGTGAVLVPVMTQVLTRGLMIYNTTTDKMQVWNGTIWNDLF